MHMSYEDPLSPEIRVDTGEKNIESCVETVVSRLKEMEIIS